MATTNQPTPWTDERIADLERWWAQKLGATEIAKRLGRAFNKNMVIGKVHRLGLPCHGAKGLKVPQKRKPDPRRKADRVAKTVAKPSIMPKPQPMRPPLAMQALPPVRFVEAPDVASTRIAFINAGFGRCHYPLWANDQRIGDVCGAETGGGPYCAFHHERCSVKVVGRWR